MKRIALLVFCFFFATSALAQAPFKIRGIKGLWWDGLQKYRLALPWIAQHDMNFLMLCYSSFPASGKDWRANYSAEELEGFKELAQQANDLHVELCLSFNPGIWSKPPLTYSSESDYQIAWNKVKTIHAVGINSFALCLDDINTKLQPADEERFGHLRDAHVYFVNRLFKQMQTLSPRPRLIFCPSAYTTAAAEKDLNYIQVIGAIDPGVFMFWTGPVTCSPSITASDAEKFGKWINRKPIVWDNYPVNDMFPWRPLEAPVKNRSADLATAVEGLMANPMKQWEASKLPLATLAEYMRDPAHYNPRLAMDHAIAEYPKDDRQVLELFVSLYGSSFLGEKNYPPRPHNAAQLRKLRDQLSATADLHDLFEDVKPTIDADLAKAQ